MLNPYSIVLGLFIIAGFITAIRGGHSLIKSQKTTHWPEVEGRIEETGLSSESHDLLPHVLFSYTVDGQTYRQTVKFSNDVSPTQEFASRYLEKFPQGATVKVYYNPDHPQDATLEPGQHKGDWLLVALGLGMTILGTVFLLG